MEPSPERVAWALMAALILIGCVITAGGFLIAALYLALLALPLPQPEAALIVGLALLGLAALLIVGWRLSARRPIADSGGRTASITAQLGDRVAREAAAAAEAHPHYTFWAAFLTGLALGRSPQARNAIETVLRAADRQPACHS